MLPRLIFHLILLLLLAVPALRAQHNVHIGFNGGYVVTWPHFEQRDLISSIQLDPTHSFSGGVNILFFISEQASVQTGFRIRSQYIQASLNNRIPAVKSRSSFPMIEIPLGFSIRQPIKPRFSVKQDFAVEGFISGGGSVRDTLSGGQPSFQVIASPQRTFNFSLMAGAGFEYHSPAGFRFSLMAEYHQGVGNTVTIGLVEYTTPDEKITLPAVSDMSYFAIRGSLSVPADKISELVRFVF